MFFVRNIHRDQIAGRDLVGGDADQKTPLSPDPGIGPLIVITCILYFLSFLFIAIIGMHSKNMGQEIKDLREQTETVRLQLQEIK